MKFNLYIYIWAILILFACSSVKNTKSVSDDQELEILDMEVDKLGDYYTIDSRGSVSKYHNKKKVFNYSNLSLGQIACVDVTNPHKVIVFYLNHQTIVLLDNSLSEIGMISLDNNSFFSAIGMANDGNIWVYDSFASKLKKINNKGDEIEESFPSGAIQPDNIVNSKIIDRGNYVVIVDKLKGVLLFNNMGFFDKIISIENISKPTIVKNNLYYFNPKSNCFVSKNIALLSEDEKICFRNFNIYPKLVLFENAKFYLLEKNKVKIYTFDHFNGN